ncbi:hypothetical protein AYK26_00470 [Euryarchaeota archaeon SM23-78]|nr:MAG: hypothetical protein AYK26_00470 [Euryarchaeota archaeon SM23-78]
MNKLSVKGFAIAFGVSWGLLVLSIDWFAALFKWGTSLANGLSSLYLWSGPSFLGGIIGALWGFVDGAIGGAIIALVYNWVVKKKK